MVRGSLWNWIGLFVTGAVNLILTPILIRQLGDFQYGIWILVYSILSYYGLLDLGMYTTSLRFVAKASGEGDRQRINEIFVNSFAITLVLAGVAILITGLLVWLMPNFLGLSEAPRQLFSYVLLLLGIGVALTSLYQFLGNYLCGLQRFDLFNIGKISSSVLRAALMLLALNRNYGLVGLAWATVVSALLALPLHWLLVRRADPALIVGRAAAGWSHVWELIGFSFFSFLTTLGNYARFYLASVVIAKVLIIHLITPFNIAAQLVEYFRMILQGVGAPLITSFSKLAGEGAAPAEVQKLFLRATKFTLLLSLFVGSLLVLDGKLFIRLWVGETFLASYTLLVILTAAYMVLLAQIPSNSLLYATNKHRALAAWTMAEGLANLALSLYLARSFGLVGVALGTAIPMAVVASLVQPWYVLRLLGLPLRVYLWRAFARPIAAWALFAAFCGMAQSSGESGGVLRLVWMVLWQTSLFWLLACWVGLSSQERKNVWKRGRQLATGLQFGRAA